MTNPFPTIPGYKILKEMGQGGMATVYLAVQESFGRQVALKIMSNQLGKDNVWAERFMHEARIVSQLSHSNIVPVFDVGSHDSRFYISMELLKGGKLDEKIAKGLTTAEIVKIICGVAAGLDYAGSKGFVHRDIKPDNIMFRDDGTPVILDFGIAKQKDGDSKMTKTGTIVGTTGYMSPEQAMAQELDERSDLYSLGIMFYELLIGHVPFRGDSAVAVLLKHVQEVPPPLPAHLNLYQSVLDKALAKKPQDRYTRGNEIIEHLQDIEPSAKRSITQSTNQSSASIKKSTTAFNQTAIKENDATIVTAAVNTHANNTQRKNRSVIFSVIGVATLALIILAWTQLDAPNKNQKNDPVLSTTKTEKKTAPEIQPTPAPASAPKSETETDSGNKRVIARILLGAHACMKQHKYDCAKSKAESALDMDPDNTVAKKIIARADKAQQDAFSGDWNAK